MEAIVLQAPFTISIKEVETPVPRPGEALIKIHMAGICGGDLHCYSGKNPYATFPSIMGHEMVGEVVAVAPETETELVVGDVVTGEILSPCGDCHACRKGKINCCKSLKVKGFAQQGTFAEYAVYKVNMLHKIPQNVGVEQAVLVEPYSIGHHMAGRAGLEAGDTALVIGVSTIGLCVVDILKSRGIRVIAADISDYKLEKSRRVGADECINSQKENLLEQLLFLTESEGAAAVIEATGSPTVMEQTPDYAAAGGTIVIAGIVDAEVAFKSILLTRKELSIHGSRNAAGDFEPVIQLLAERKLHPTELLTSVFPFHNAAEAFAHLHENGSREIKVAISMRDA